MLLLFGGLILIGVVVTWQVRAILNAPFPRLRGFQTLISGIPLLLVVFAAVYYLTGQAQPDGFSEPMDKIGAMYFTVTVFSTVGFGDITAKTDLARTLVTIQMLFNLVVIGLVAKVIFGAVDIGLKNAQPTTTNHPRSQNSPNRQPAGVLSDQEMITGTSCGSMRRELPGTSAANTAAPRDPRGSAGRGDVAVDRDDDRCPDVIVVEQHGGVAGDVTVVPPPAVPVADTDAIARGRAVGRRDAVDDGVSARLLGCGFEDALACERRFAPLRHVVECGDDFSGGEDRRGAPVRRDDRLARWLVLVADPVEMWSAMSAVPVGKVVCVIAERAEDPLFVHVGDGLAGDLFDHRVEQHVVGVGVLPAPCPARSPEPRRARTRRSPRVPTRRVAEEFLLELRVRGVAQDAAGHVGQLTQRRPCPGRATTSTSPATV